MDNPEKLITLDTQDTGRRQTKQKYTKQNANKISNTNPTKNLGMNSVSAKDKKILLFIRHPQCYSYGQYVLDTIMRIQTQI
jgi:hypothetical protein